MTCDGARANRAVFATSEPAPIAIHGRSRLIAVALLCGLCELCAIAIYAIHFARWPWQDWMVYYGAARAYLDGKLWFLFDAPRFTAYLNTAFAAWLPAAFPFRSWVYPPPFLLLLLPFGLLPFAASCILFQFTTLVGLLTAIWHYLGRRRRMLCAVAVIFSPPTAFNLGTGQNGFLTGALLVGGFGVLDRRPGMAGVLLGLLTYKPQFWPLAALALAAAGRWRALATTIATASIMVAASLAVFGVEPWRAWLEWAAGPPVGEYQSFLKCCLLHDESVYTNLTILGASPGVANAMQLTAFLAGAGCVWWCYRHSMPQHLQLAALLVATSLAAPHFANYDGVLLVVAAALLVADGLDYGFRPGGLIVPALVCMVQLLNPPDVFRAARITPLLTILLIACIIDRARGGATAVSATGVGRNPSDAVRRPIDPIVAP